MTPSPTENTSDLGEVDKLMAEASEAWADTPRFGAGVGAARWARSYAAALLDALTAQQREIEGGDARIADLEFAAQTYGDRAEDLAKERDALKAWTENDREDEWTATIRAAHPMQSSDPKRHDHYQTAMDMVRNRRSKAALVDLVCWLVSRATKAEAKAEELAKEREQLHLAICGGEDAPGYAASLSTARVIEVCELNYREWRDDVDRATKAEAEVAELRERAEAVLEPFLRPVKDIMPHWPDDDYATLEALVLDPLTIGDFRRAAELHARLSPMTTRNSNEHHHD